MNPPNELPRRSRAVRTALYLAGALALAAIVAGGYAGIRIARGELRLTDDVEALADMERSVSLKLLERQNLLANARAYRAAAEKLDSQLASRLGPLAYSDLAPLKARLEKAIPGAAAEATRGEDGAVSVSISGAGGGSEARAALAKSASEVPSLLPVAVKIERGQWVVSLRFEPVPEKTPPEVPAPRFAPPPPPLFSSARSRELRAKIAFERLSVMNMEGGLAEVRAAAWHARAAKAQLLALEAKDDQAALRAIDALLGGRR